jgi:hypothetical protein
VNPAAKPRKQKLRMMSEEKVEARKAEVQRLLDAGFIRGVTYPQWLTNVLMVWKRMKNEKCELTLPISTSAIQKMTSSS